MSRVFLDTNLFIYIFEGMDERATAVVEALDRLKTRGDSIVTSTMTIGEILVKPMSLGDHELCRTYEGLLNSPWLEVVSFGSEASLRYAEIRQDRTIRPPDAIQLACSAASRCDLFLTNDRGMARKMIPGVPFISTLESLPF